MQDKATELIIALGKLVQRYRKLKGKTIYKISAEACLPKSTWRRIENALQQDVNLTTFIKVADGLEVSPDILMKELITELGKDFSLGDE